MGQWLRCSLNTYKMGNHIDSVQVEFLLNKAKQSINIKIHSYFDIVSPCKSVKIRTMVSSLPLLATIVCLNNSCQYSLLAKHGILCSDSVMTENN